MKKGRKCIHSVLLVILLIVNLLLPGCSSINDAETVDMADDERVTLRVLTEESTEDTRVFCRALNNIKVFFRKEHENVDIEIEYLPVDSDEREVVLTQLRTEIMAGKGPDIYLLPTTEIQETYAPVLGELVEPLFPDVNQAMYNGLFCDISAYYDADDDLGKDELVTAVMDAGVVGDARYVLPLRYNIPVAYVDLGMLEKANLGTEIFDSGISGLMDTLAQNEVVVSEAPYPGYIRPMVLNYFPEVLDYENQKVLLTKEELTDFMKSYQLFKSLQQGKRVGYPTTPSGYSMQEPHWALNGGLCMQLDALENAVNQAVVAKAAGIDVGMYPLTTPDGTLVADVTFYGAVDYNCEYPDLAYAF